MKKSDLTSGKSRSYLNCSKHIYGISSLRSQKMEFLSSPGNIAKHVAGFALKIIALRSVSISFIPVWHACITFFGGQNMLQVSFLIRSAFVHTIQRAGKARHPFSWHWDGTRKAVVYSSTQFLCVPQFSWFCLAKF